MNEEIFRKKSLDKIKSPESLDDYIRVSNPGIWLLLVSIIALLIGACIWGIFGHLDSTVAVTVTVEGSEVSCFAEGDSAEFPAVGMEVTFGSYHATVAELGPRESNGIVCRLTAQEQIPDGTYAGKMITERIRPLSFIIN